MSEIESIEYAQIEPSQNSAIPMLEQNLEIIKDVKVTLQVRIGEAELTVDQLMNLNKDSVIKMSCSTTAPVDVLLDGKIVARGNLVSADDNFGVQITELAD